MIVVMHDHEYVTLFSLQRYNTSCDFSRLVDVDIRSGDDGLDDPLAIGALAIASGFKRLTRLHERETIGTFSTTNIGHLFR
jgi:hypothetical protein